MITYSSISNKEAISFLSQSKANLEQISISDADFWCGATYKNNLLAVVGFDHTKNTVRIKAFFVDKKRRGNGIGKDLLNYAINNDEIISMLFKAKEKATVFATVYSKPIFESLDFVSVKTNKNKITFMEKELKK